MASRIWITCEHEHLGPHLTRELPTAISNEGWCQGGRVLTEGEYVLIEKVDGEWPEWIEDEGFKLKIHDAMRRLFVNVAPLWRNTSAVSHHHPNYAPSLVCEILDALAGGES